MIIKGYLGGIPIDLTADDPHIQYTKADGTRAFTGVISGISPIQQTHLATKGYVDTMAAGVGFEPVLSKYDPTGGLPGTPTTGDRYLSTATANGWVIDRLYDYNGVTWDEETPSTGDTVLVVNEAVQYAYATDEWISLITTDHGALEGLADDDHPQYLKLNKVGQTLDENLLVTALKTIDGRDLSVDGAKLDLYPAIPTSGLKFLTTPVNKISWTAATGWTDVDISADTGADTAIAALINIQLNFDGHSAADYEGYVRKNGSAITANLARVRGRVYAGVSWIATTDSSCVIVPVDESEIFEARLAALVAGVVGGLTFKIDLLGYFV